MKCSVIVRVLLWFFFWILGVVVEEMLEDEEIEEDEDGMVDEENELEDEIGVDEDRLFFK